MVDQTMRYTANFAYPADQMMCMSNRSRSESGSSESSRGSGNSGKPPRRRSHRPRGCRGGSNRRRNNSADFLKNKRANNFANCNNENKPKLENATSLVAPNKAASQTISYPVTGRDFSILSREQQVSKGGYADCSTNNYPVETSFSSMSANTTPMTDYASSSNGSFDTSSFRRNHNSVDYPTIQTSFSDSSSEGAMEQRIFPSMQQQQPFPNAREGILPPLPSSASHQGGEPIPTGPNPYALKLATHRDNFYPPEPNNVQPHHDPRFMHGGYQGANNYDHALFQPHPQYSKHITPPQYHPSANNPNHSHEYDYRAERLEKQRQNVVGGSLFVTSPRSFLMGLKKT